jgi:hypothetical protein
VETSCRFALIALTAQAKQALRTMGFRASDVSRFVEAALADQPIPPTFEALIVSALERSAPPVEVHKPDIDT